MALAKSRERRGSAPLGDLDDDLLRAVPREQRRYAAALRLPTLEVTRGGWAPAPRDDGTLGYLVAAGTAFRCVHASGHATAELLGRGDVLPVRPDPRSEPGDSDPCVAWHVLERMTLAILDARFLACAARWPRLTWTLLERRCAATDSLMVRFALVHRQRVDERVLLVLWGLAERWGRVTREGVLVPIPLRHHQIAALTASLRPSVSLALQRLAARGVVERCVRGYMLYGTLDEALGSPGGQRAEDHARRVS